MNKNLKPLALQIGCIIIFQLFKVELIWSIFWASIIVAVGLSIYEPILEAYFRFLNRRKLEDEIFRIKLHKNGQIIHAVVPEKLRRKYKKRFGTEFNIEIDAYNDFLTSNMSNVEAIEYFAENKIKTDQLVSIAAVPQNEAHLGNTKFHISYYSNTGELIVITELNGVPITKGDKESFTEYVQNNIKRGEKVYEEDLLRWQTTESKKGSN